jgi:hypothetical protein
MLPPQAGQTNTTGARETDIDLGRRTRPRTTGRSQGLALARFVAALA